MKDITRVFDLLEYNKSCIKNDIVAGKKNGEWTKYGTIEFIELVDCVSRGLLTSGIQRGDKVAIMSPNRPEWNICDFGIMQIGATQVPMYPTLAEHDIQFILQDAEVKIIFVSDQALADKLSVIKKNVNPGLRIYTFDHVGGESHWLEIVNSGKNDSTDLEYHKSGITSDDLLTLIYTSGTTGTPKGVMLTHQNLLSNFLSCSALYPPNFKRALSFLPLSHIFERMVIYMYFYLGISIYYAESMETIVADINDVKPDGFTTVPRLLEKVYDRIVAKGSELTGIKKKMFYWALNLGLRYELKGANGWWYEFQLRLARILIFSKWRQALGGNVKALVSGGAALQPRLARVFWAAGIPVLEGYGLTETSPVITVNGLGNDQIKFGTVGKPIKDVEVKIAEDGEILCKGPNVMKGYYNRQDLTEQAIDAEGYFHTGDIGELSSEGFLRITDRKKEMFKTAGGKFVAPQVLETKFKESTLIEHVMVVGENQRFPAALIVPAFEVLRDWCLRHNIPYSNSYEVIKLEPVVAKYQQEIDKYNQDFGRWEQVKKIALLPEEWSIDGGELTPKLSLRRKIVLEKYKDIIQEIYTDPGAGGNKHSI